MPKGVYQHSEEHNRKIGLTKLGNKNCLGKNIGNKHNWKGDNIGYRQLHRWVRNHLPQPDKCEFCNQNWSTNKKRPTHLANITGVYNRELHNWKYFCGKCHVYYDGNVYNLDPYNKIKK